MLQFLCFFLNKAGHQSPPTVCLLGLFWSPREVSQEVTGGTSSFQPLLMSSYRKITRLRVSLLPGLVFLRKCQISSLASLSATQTNNPQQCLSFCLQKRRPLFSGLYHTLFPRLQCNSAGSHVLH